MSNKGYFFFLGPLSEIKEAIFWPEHQKSANATLIEQNFKLETINKDV